MFLFLMAYMSAVESWKHLEAMAGHFMLIATTAFLVFAGTSETKTLPKPKLGMSTLLWVFVEGLKLIHYAKLAVTCKFASFNWQTLGRMHALAILGMSDRVPKFYHADLNGKKHTGGTVKNKLDCSSFFSHSEIGIYIISNFLHMTVHTVLYKVALLRICGSDAGSWAP